MKVPPRQIEQFLRQPAAEVRAILLYGADGGLLRERVQRLIGVVLDDPGDPFRFSELTPASLKDEPSRLADEMAALSLTGGRRLVRLRQTGNAQSAAIQAVLDDPGEASSDTLLLVEGGELSPRDSLRKLFESHARAAAVPCYADEGQTLETLICDSLAARGLGIEPSALAYLMANLGADRQITRSELEKLALFK
ncbi:MAG: DNA polymerase III subunit delta, partial [Alphaproteobacteria bacterium]|nr:DNA polymerase III subunit delta [Alphaproteobacteria bacterium]